VVKKNRARRTKKVKVKEDESNQGFDVLTDPVEDLQFPDTANLLPVTGLATSAGSVAFTASPRSRSNRNVDEPPG
jgi:hypothetical protein